MSFSCQFGGRVSNSNLLRHHGIISFEKRSRTRIILADLIKYSPIDGDGNDGKQLGVNKKERRFIGSICPNCSKATSASLEIRKKKSGMATHQKK